MRCPFCGCDDTQVKDSRAAEDGSSIRRRRQCGACGARFTTFERVQLRELIVVKSSGRKVAFDRDKLMRSVQVALRKRNVDPERVEQMVTGITRRLEAMGDAEIDSKLIGELVMEGLECTSVSEISERDLDNLDFYIEMDLDVPFVLRPFKGKAMGVIEEEIKKWIAKAKAGEL